MIKYKLNIMRILNFQKYLQISLIWKNHKQTVSPDIDHT